jgi:predicted TIM-barrel fold metal-dependent hydrolase
VEIIDAQLHLNRLGTDSKSCVDLGIAVMDALGIDAVVIDEHDSQLLPTGAFRYQYPVSVLAAARFPSRYAYVAKIDPRDPELDVLMSEVRTTPGCLGIRIVPGRDHFGLLREGKIEILAAAQRHQVPVMISPRGESALLAPWARQFAELQLIVDHVGLIYPPQKPVGPDSFAALDDLIALARYPNIAVKWGHVPVLSRESFPYRDLLPHLHRVLDAFGPERVMWESDYTWMIRTPPSPTYAEALLSIRHAEGLSEGDKEWILGKAARAILRWPRAPERRSN